ncbi:hypothetical protein MTY66_60120 [Mycolicibacterium sp. TY66]|nr:hypothetical protein MTY66_60120 [Mycolicibacterium sp. TY66]BCJ83991.1 hypothetical protein MTY81_53640 [Mycolicibacterium sp. TY81]
MRLSKILLVSAVCEEIALNHSPHAEEGFMNDYEAVGLKLGGVSRSTVFRLWSSGELPSVRVGRRRFSTDKQIADYVARLEGAA